MKFAWYRLLLQAIGVLLIGLAVPRVFSVAASASVWYSLGTGRFGGYPVMGLVLDGLAPIIQLVIGLYLLSGAKRIVFISLRGIDTTCARCGYSLESIVGDVCPECSLRFRDGAAAPSSSPGSPAPRTDQAD